MPWMTDSSALPLTGAQEDKGLGVFRCEVDVNGDNTAPIYKFLKSSKGGLFGENIKWNFSKFLVDKEGRVVERYAPTTSPLSIEKDIKKLLGNSTL
ncbi:hypothetical protein PR202_gb29948 [Eleusine coracana subsp. coracana]|uniref:Glutathione peroxidase n=1 Tax=Eleusine coracana subsp. coracana TaxID=191504 RepID=A0AAV5G171_ELECO|nr:hypothetical protein PR202_gb29948 [Eleusine coracana subsp. coracana]